MTALGPALEAAAGAVEKSLAALIPDPAGLPYAGLVRAMRYASLEGGKRLRPFLVLQCAELFGGAAGRHGGGAGGRGHRDGPLLFARP